MADDIEPGSGKKHRIIHWNPNAGNEKVKRRWTLPRILLTGIVGFAGLIIAARVVVETIKFVRPGTFDPAVQTGPVDPVVEFRSQNDARFELDNATKAFATVGKLSFQDHTKQVDKYLLIQKDFNEGNRLYAEHEYSRAYRALKSVNERISEFALSIQTKAEAQNLYSALLLKIREAEALRNLAPEAVSAATTAAADANRLLADGDFLLAKQQIEQGMAELKKVDEALAAKVQESIWNGQQALLKGDRQAGLAAFRSALERAPDNEAAKQGLKRAETIDRVHALLLRGEDFEKKGEYDQAAEAFKNAFSLDAFSATAQQGESRNKQLSIDSRFNAAYQAAQDAMGAKDWTKAIAQAKAALAVTAKPEVSELLKKAEQSQHNDALQRGLRRGREAEDRNDWVAAKDGYEEARKVEPQNQDATDGIIRVNTIIRALKAYETKIEVAEQFAARNDFQGAINAFNEAMEFKPSYLAESEKTQQLHATLVEQSNPVDVTFKSDGKTFVSIEGFKNLAVVDGAVTIKVSPGDYTIVGRRAGYKEVVIPVQIRGGRPLTIPVVCTVRDTQR